MMAHFKTTLTQQEQTGVHLSSRTLPEYCCVQALHCLSPVMPQKQLQQKGDLNKQTKKVTSIKFMKKIYYLHVWFHSVTGLISLTGEHYGLAFPANALRKSHSNTVFLPQMLTFKDSQKWLMFNFWLTFDYFLALFFQMKTTW